MEKAVLVQSIRYCDKIVRRKCRNCGENWRPRRSIANGKLYYCSVDMKEQCENYFPMGTGWGTLLPVLMVVFVDRLSEIIRQSIMGHVCSCSRKLYYSLFCLGLSKQFDSLVNYEKVHLRIVYKCAFGGVCGQEGPCQILRQGLKSKMFWNRTQTILSAMVIRQCQA